MSARLLLIGDIHLRAGEQLDDVADCLTFAGEVARERQADAVLFAGDVFEGRTSPAERLAFAAGLAGFQVPVVISKGNHDQAGDLMVFDGYPDVRVFEAPGIVRIESAFVRSRGSAVDILCVPWPERAYLAALGHTGEAGDQAGSAALAAMLRGMVADRKPGIPFIILGHLSVLGAITSSAQPLVGKGIEAVLGDLQDLGAAFVALGHVHKPQELAPGIEYIGSITVHDFGEETEAKRIGILDVEDDGTASVEWVPVPCRRWVTIEASVHELVAAGGGMPAACSVIESVGREDGIGFSGDDLAGYNVRYRYSCTEDEVHLFDHDAIRRRFASAHTLKIVPEIERTQRVRAAEVAAARTVEEKLCAWGAATGVEITAAHIEKLHQLESEAAR